MITYFCALKPEYAAVKDFFGLRHKTDAPFISSENETVRAVFTGTGISSAMAVCHIGSLSAKTSDIYINAGVCACSDKASVGDLFHAVHIYDSIYNRHYYPYAVNFGISCASAATVACPVTAPMDFQEQDLFLDTVLYDMESAFFFQAACKYRSIDKIFCFKVVSDFFEPQNVTGKTVYDLVYKILPRIQSFSFKSTAAKETIFPDEAEYIKQKTAGLFYTEAMKEKLINIIFYLKSLNISPIDFFKDHLIPESENKKQTLQNLSQIEKTARNIKLPL